MRKLFKFVAINATLFFSLTTNLSCNKTGTSTEPVSNNSVSNLLMNKQWIVGANYINSTGLGTGTMVYQRGATNNSQHLDSYIFVFWPDSLQYFVNPSSHTTYAYKFISSDSTELLINNTQADYAKIVVLTTNQLAILDSTNSELTFYEYKP